MEFYVLDFYAIYFQLSNYQFIQILVVYQENNIWDCSYWALNFVILMKLKLRFYN